MTYYAEGAKFYSDVLHLGVVSEHIRGVEFALEDGTHIVAQLLSDDLGTWVPWLLRREMMPGAVARPKQALLLGPEGEISLSPAEEEEELAAAAASNKRPAGGPPTMASVRATCPEELARCEVVGGCLDVLSGALAGSGAEPSALGFSAFEAVYKCVEAARQ